MRHTFCRLIFAGVGFLLPLYANAWENCLELAGDPRFQCLAAYEVVNTGDLDFEMALADAASQAGNPAYAAVVLERVVRRDPSNAGARLDLAILSLSAGDQFTARHQLEYLNTLPNPPPVVAELLLRLELQINPLQVDRSQLQPRIMASMGLGYDDNPNFGINANTVDLIVDGGGLTLIPADVIRPDPSPFAMATAQVDYPYSRTGWVQAMVGARQYEKESDNDSVSTSARIQHGLNGHRYIEALLADFRMRDGLYMSRAGAGLVQNFGECRCNSAGFKLDYIDASEQTLITHRARIELEALRKRGIVAMRLYGSLDYQHQPNADWGDTSGVVVGVDALADFGPLTWTLGLLNSSSYDDSPYSPLFGSKQRDLQWQQVRSEVSFGVTQGLELYIDWSFQHQESDIPLYDFDRQFGTLGLRTVF